MAVTINRAPWTALIDDSGGNLDGSVWNKAAIKTTLLDPIDAALAGVAQLAGGNSFTGNQSVAGLLAVTGFGIHSYFAGGSGGLEVRIQNTAAGAGSSASITVGNDTLSNLLQLTACSSTYTPNVYLQPNTGALISGGTGGLNLGTTGGPVKVWTSYAERLRVTPTGELLINTAANLASGQLTLVSEQTHTGLVVQNTNPANGMTFAAFMNSAAGIAGTITQSGASAVAYNTSSDARLKDDAGRATDVAALRAVVVHDFTWKADGVRARGVFAQEAREVFPRAITAGTDDLTDDGSLARPWMTDYSQFVPDLIVGWQQHDAAIAAIQAALARRVA